MAADDYATGNPAGYIRGLLAEGTAPTPGLAAFRAEGGAIQESRWFDLYHEVQDTYARYPEQLGIDPFNVPGPADYGEWTMGRGGQYASQVQITVYDRDLGEFVSMQHTYITDQPHTGVEAEADAWDNFDPENTGADYNQTMVGALTTSYWKTTPYT